ADIDLSTELSHSLQGSETWASWLQTPLRMLRGEKAHDHLSQVLASRKQMEQIFNKAKVSKEFHTKLNQKLIGFVNNQSDIALFPYNNTNNILLVDESAIVANNPDSKLKFKHNMLQNPEILSSEQALDYNQCYKNKQNKLKIAKDAYLKFIDLIKGNQLQLTYAQRCQARILYPIFQAYFVCGAPEQRRQEIIDCDTYLSQMFAIKKITAPMPARGLFDNLHQHYQKLFADTEKNWQQQSQKYLLLAQEQFQAEHYAQKLEVNDINKTRAHYLIKHPEYSQAVKEFRISLHNIIKQFNTAMQTELTISAPDRLPYPEVEDANTVLAQPKQVLAVKQIINSLYHVEQIVYQLEQVKEVPATESKLTRPFNEFRNSVYYLIMAYSHLNQIIKASKSLIKDPHLKLMGQDLLEKAQTTLATLQEHTYAYGVAPPVTAPKNDTVRYNALWYVINSVFVIPIHIRSLRNNNYISAEELNELNLQAKNATVTIETIIKDSGSYLKLFLLAPNMHKLYQRLKKKLNEFTSTTHDAVMHNLAEIQTSIFAPMLLEADLWEDRMGLSPGIISGPMKRIIEEYYKGLLYPLGLYSKKHLSLICDKSIFSKRQEVAHSTIVESKNKLSHIKEKIQHIEKLYELLKLNDPYFKPDDHQLWSAEFEEKAIALYRLCIPRLAKIQQKLNIQIKNNANERKFDSLLQAKNQFNDPKISNIRAVVHAAFHYYKGREKTAAMNQSIAEEKIVYIKDLQQKQVQEDLKFIEEYTTKAYHRELNAICNRHVGLQYMDKEYSKELRIHLLKFEKSIIMASKTAEDINLSIQTMLRKRASQFEKRQFADYYHLDSVRAALAGFKIYLSNETADKHSLFEDDKTLNAKSECIKIVDDIASNADLSIAERFKQIKQQVVIDGSFKKVLCARKDTDFLSWTYLKQCFINLLEAIYLYSSPRKKLSTDIVSAVNNKPEIKVLINRFGLFSANPQKPKANISPAIVLPEPKLLT
ncbi:MAG: protein SdhA, partial [Legionella sp.]